METVDTPVPPTPRRIPPPSYCMALLLLARHDVIYWCLAGRYGNVLAGESSSADKASAGPSSAINKYSYSALTSYTTHCYSYSVM